MVTCVTGLEVNSMANGMINGKIKVAVPLMDDYAGSASPRVVQFHALEMQRTLFILFFSL